MWMLLQSSAIFAVIASNIHWQWTPNKAIPALAGVGLAYILTRVVSGVLQRLLHGKSSQYRGGLFRQFPHDYRGQ